MRKSFTRCCLILLLAAATPGCYSNGRWTMPDLAFWNHTPFSSSDDAIATSDDDTPRPSELAVAPGPEPGAGYGDDGAVNTSLPDYPVTAGVTDAPPYTPSGNQTAQQPYAAAQPASYGPTAENAPAAPSYGHNATPQQGSYSAAPPANAPYGSAPSYEASNQGYAGAGYQAAPRHDASGYSAAPGGQTQPYAGGYGAEQPVNYNQQVGGGYAPAGANPSYANPVRGTNAGQYGTRTADARGWVGEAPAYGSGSPAYRSDTNAAAPSDASGSGYASPGGYQTPDADGAPHYTLPNDNNGYRGASSNEGPSDYQPGQTGYQPGASDYQPGNTGYRPPVEVPPYQPPAGAWNAPSSTGPEADAGQADRGYAPGSIQRYQPTSSAARPDPNAVSRNDRVDTSILPVSYGAPMWR